MNDRQKAVWQRLQQAGQQGGAFVPSDEEIGIMQPLLRQEAPTVKELVRAMMPAMASMGNDRIDMFITTMSTADPQVCRHRLPAYALHVQTRGVLSPSLRSSWWQTVLSSPLTRSCHLHHRSCGHCSDSTLR